MDPAVYFAPAAAGELPDCRPQALDVPVRGWRAKLSVTWDEKARVIKGVAAGLAHAHRRGVIHRDVRPRNVVIAPGGVVKLGNFDLRSSRTPRT